MGDPQAPASQVSRPATAADASAIATMQNVLASRLFVARIHSTP